MALTCAEMKEVKYRRYIGIIASAAPRKMAFTGVWNLSLTFDSARGITLSNDHARKSLLMKTRLSHDQADVPDEEAYDDQPQEHAARVQEGREGVGTIDSGAPLPPFWIAHASMKGSPMTLSSM